MRKPLKGFITYSHKDTEEKDELRDYLAVMKQNEELVTWDDGQLTPGDEALQEDILEKVADSDLLLYLVSAASLASTNCNRELAKALKQNIRIIPIILKHCDWQRHQLSGFEVLPDKGRPLTKWDDKSEGWQNVVEGIRKAVEDKSEDSQNVVESIREEDQSRFMSESARNKPLVEWVFQLGNFLLMLREIDRAIEAYSHAIDLNPDFADAYNNRGIAYADTGDFAAAVADYNTAIDLDPEEALPYNNRGVAYRNTGDFDAAIADFNKAMDLDPEKALPYNNRGVAYRDMGDFDAAIADYNTAIDLDPEEAGVYNNRGIAYRNTGDFDAAIADFNKAIDLDPEKAQVYYNRGNTYTNTGDFDAAIADFNKAIALNPENAGAYCYLGEAWLHLREWQKAKADLTTAKDMGFDIIASFQNDYKSVEDFEAKNKVKIPEDIAALLQRK